VSERAGDGQSFDLSRSLNLPFTCLTPALTASYAPVSAWAPEEAVDVYLRRSDAEKTLVEILGATRTRGACRLSRTRFRCFGGRGRVAMSLSAGADRRFEVSRGDRAAHCRPSALDNPGSAVAC
jgi:hypothetical protein